MEILKMINEKEQCSRTLNGGTLGGDLVHGNWVPNDKTQDKKNKKEVFEELRKIEEIQIEIIKKKLELLKDVIW